MEEAEEAEEAEEEADALYRNFFCRAVSQKMSTGRGLATANRICSKPESMRGSELEAELQSASNSLSEAGSASEAMAQVEAEAEAESESML